MTLEYATVDAVKARIKWAAGASTADNDELAVIVGQANGYIEFYIGCAVGPTGRTSMILDGRDAKSGGHMLRVPSGIRSISSLTIDGSAVDLSTVYLRPLFPLPGWPFQQIWSDDDVFSPYYASLANVVAVGAFDFEAIPVELSEVAEITAQRAWYARQAGQKDTSGTDQNGNPMISRYVSARDRETLNEYRDRIGIKRLAVSVAIDL